MSVKVAPAMACLHCGQPIQQVQHRNSPFWAWRHLDGRMWCGKKSPHVATPEYSR